MLAPAPPSPVSPDRYIAIVLISDQLQATSSLPPDRSPTCRPPRRSPAASTSSCTASVLACTPPPRSPGQWLCEEQSQCLDGTSSPRVSSSSSRFLFSKLSFASEAVGGCGIPRIPFIEYAGCLQHRGEFKSRRNKSQLIYAKIVT